MLRWDHSRCSLYPFSFVFSMWLLWRKSLHPLCSYSLHTGILLWGPSRAFFFPRRKGLIPSVLRQRACPITLWSFLWPFFLVWTLSGLSASFLNWGDENWVWYCRCGLRNTEQREMITSLPRLVNPLRIQPSIQSLAAVTHCWLMVSLLSTKTPKSLGAQLLPSHINPKLCWALWLYCPKCRTLHLSVKCHTVLATPLFQSVQLSVGWLSLLMCHEQTRWRHFQSLHPSLWKCWTIFIPEGWLVTGCQPE